MDKPLHKVLKTGSKFLYEYDFGSTTEIEGEIIAIHQGQLDKKVKLLARNLMPETPCAHCQKPAQNICSCCLDFCCLKCRKKHPCEDNEMMSPIVNSPRMGVCGYEGSID